LKASTELSFGNNNSKIRESQQNISVESDCHWILSTFSRTLYNEMQKMKQNNKEMYLKIMLFIKFPYSVCYRYNEIMRKINEREEGMNSM
jgi:hypothetical protein